ncbi:hypothetical protein [Kitasatospora sp. NPDC056184]|uniref:hypothetical protein n=1 Tax=Kitasatospora sp. NPDC056184 TaxID=3345738 RepID=UPI0035DB9E4F
MAALDKVRRPTQGVTVANRKLRKIIKEQRRQATEACEALREVATAAGCPLPSLGVDSPSVITGECLVDVGRARPESVLHLADVLRVGLATLAAESSPVVPLFRPKVGDLVVDTESGRVGEYAGVAEDGWTLRPFLMDGPKWTADPLHVRTATTNERVRTAMTLPEPAKVG